jgi:alpha-L-fucosidase
MASRFTRRKFPERSVLLATVGVSAPLWQSRAGAQAASTSSAAPLPAIAPGPFKGSRDSLNAYQMPDWFADAKFGIWNR